MVLHFDGFPSEPEGGVGVVLTSLEGKSLALSYKIAFACTNNEAKYEALVLGLLVARSIGIKNILVKGDSNFVIRQVTDHIEVKEPFLAIYRECVFTLAQALKSFKFHYMPRVENKQADALATFGAKVQLEGAQAKCFSIAKKIQPFNILEMPYYSMEEDDWHQPIMHKLKSPKSSHLGTLKGLYLYDDQLFKRSSDGLLM